MSALNGKRGATGAGTVRGLSRGARAKALISLAAVCFVAVGYLAPESTAQALSWTVSIYRMPEQNAPVVAGSVSTSDYAVWAKVVCQSPFAVNQTVQARWLAPDGTLIVEQNYSVGAGTGTFWVWMKIAGTVAATKQGMQRIDVSPAGFARPSGTATYQVRGLLVWGTVAAISAKPASPAPAGKPAPTAKPAVTGVLAQGHTEKLEPVGPTTEFFSDSKVIWVVYKTASPAPAGHSLSARIYKTTGELAATGTQPHTTNGRASAFIDGYYIAGQSWAQSGGNFVYKIFWDNDPAPVAQLPFTVKAAHRWALLVGISKYPKRIPVGAPAGTITGEDPLPGSDVDARSMRDLLVNSFGFPDDSTHLRVVLDRDARKARIVSELNDMASRAGPEDAVVFFYSGHGALVPDLSGREETGWDEAIVPYEPLPEVITTADEVNQAFLLHQELAELRRKFKTPNVTIIFDSCHSGNAVRAAQPGELPLKYGKLRSVAVEFSRDIQETAQKARQLQQGQVPSGPVEPPDRYVFLAAARPWESSLGGPEGGTFTNALVATLKAESGESWGEILSRVRSQVARDNPGQEPNLIGAASRLPFSMAGGASDLPYARPSLGVVGILPPNPEKIQLGSPGSKDVDVFDRLTEGGTFGAGVAVTSGVSSVAIDQIGALYAAYPALDTSFQGQPKGRVQISGKFVGKAVYIDAKREALPAEGSTANILSGLVERGDRLVPLSVRVPPARPKVLVAGSEDAAANQLGALLEKNLAALPDLEMMQEGDLNELDYLIIPKMRGTLAMADVVARGFPVSSFTGTPDSVATRIRELVQDRHQLYSRVVRLNNLSPPFRFVADFVGGDFVRRPGEKVRIRVTTSRAVCVTVLAANDSLPPYVITSSDVPVQPGKPWEFDVNVPADFGGRLALKFLATPKPLALGSFQTLPANSRADTLIGALRGQVGAGGGGADFLSADGWADAILWLTVNR